MLHLVLLALIAAIIIFVIIVLMQPSVFRISRSITMAAAPEAPFALVNDFHRWEAWSPWAKMDPNSKSVFDGPDSGVGATLSWEGNNKVGKGSMTITESAPAKHIVIQLTFLKPMKGSMQAEFTFVPEGGNTVVTWSATSNNGFMGKAMGLIMNCEKMIGGLYDQGLANMKAIAEEGRK